MTKPLIAEQIENCGRVLSAFPETPAQATLLRVILSALRDNHHCLTGISENLGIATKISDEFTLASLFDRDNPREAHDPFSQSIYIFGVLGQDIYYQNQIDGAFYRFGESRSWPQ